MESTTVHTCKQTTMADCSVLRPRFPSYPLSVIFDNKTIINIPHSPLPGFSVTFCADQLLANLGLSCNTVHLTLNKHSMHNIRKHWSGMTLFVEY